MIRAAFLAILAVAVLATPAAFRQKYETFISGELELDAGPSDSFFENMYHEFLQAFRLNEPKLNGYLSLDVDRKEVFKANMERIRAHNQDTSNTWQMGVSKFSDMTWQEFKDYHLMKPQKCSATNTQFVEAPPRDFVDSIFGGNDIDWRARGKVSNVKDQGNCGSCWTFSTTGAIESRYAIRYGGKMPLVSEQQLIDCAQAFDNHGCNGGLPS